MMGVCALAILLSLFLSVSKGKPPPPLHLSPMLDDGRSQEARDASYIKTDLIPPSHAGFITVNKTLGNHLFFWFFPVRDNKESSSSSSSTSSSSSSSKSPGGNSSSLPLLLWLNGGPGVSSMLGLFWEHGPLEVVPSESDGKSATFRKRHIAWADHFSVVYVDNPVGVGYSYSDQGEAGYRLTQDGYSMDLQVFVEQFFIMFPEYSNTDFYIGGQSYAGRYVPSVAYRIHNSIKDGESNIPLKGIYLGAPYYDCQNQMKPFYEYLYSVGSISYADMLKHKERVSKLYNDFEQGRTKNLTLVEIFRTLVAKVGLKSMDNYVCGKDPDYASITEVMTSTEMRNLLQVGGLGYRCISDNYFFGLYGEDIFHSCTNKLAVLLDNYKVLIYTGDFDVVVSSRMVDEALMKTPWSLQDQFIGSSRSPWVDRQTDDLLGFYSTTGRLCRVVVHGAGHQVPHDQPERSIRMMKNFIEKGCVGDEDVIVRVV